MHFQLTLTLAPSAAIGNPFLALYKPKQDEMDQAVQRALKNLISERVPRELEKMQDQVVRAKKLAQIFREIMTVSTDAK
jgi:predicted component of type VI protein secretion system